MTNDELRAELAKYVCILSSGFIEASCRRIIHRYASTRCQKPVLSYVVQNVDRLRSPNTTKILELIGAFDKEKSIEVERSLDEKQKTAVDSIIAIRHLIAHGRNSGISLATIKDYHDRAQNFIVNVERLLCD